MSKYTQPIIMWLVATLFSFLQFFLQILTNTMSEPLMLSFNLSPGEVGILSSAFFYTFIAMQIPAGYLLEKYSPKNVLTTAALLCATGSVLFAMSHTLWFAIIARTIMGLGAGFGFLGMLTITRIWFDIRFFSLLVGISEFIAMLLTAGSEKLMVHTVNFYGWRTAMLWIAAFSIVMAILLFTNIRNRHDQHYFPTHHFLSQLKYVLKKPACWMAGIYGFGMFAVVTAFNALWGLEFLSNVYNFTEEQAATGISIVFIGLAIGCPIIGVLVAKFRRKLLIMAVFALVSLIVSTLLIVQVMSYTHDMILFLLFILGFACGSYYLCYEVAAEYVDNDHKAMAIAFCSMLVIMGAVILQPAMGYVMQLLGYQEHVDVSHLTLVNAFETAMLFIILVQIIAFLMTLVLRRKPRSLLV